MAEVVLNQRYRLTDKVGEGGMARVYKAEDLLLGRTVAVKILREQYAADEAFLQRFRQEARAAAGLSHPNVVSIYDVGVDGDQNYIVMEYVSGPTLKELIRREAPFSAARAVEIALQVLAAIGAAHQRGIIHRDLKPQNILVTAEGQVKVADFGIARAASGAQFTETGVVLGTVHYMSPEQATGQPASAATDLYSLGVILYEMLTGVLPFDSESPLGVALKHVQEEPEPPVRLNPKVPAQLSAMVLRALAKDPTQRFASAEQMRLALRSYLEFGDQATSPITPVRPMAARAAARPPVAQPQKKGIDWFVLIASVLILGFIVGSVPVALRVYEAYMMPAPGSAAPSTPANTGGAQGQPTESPAAEPTSPPQAVVEATSTPTPSATPTPSPHTSPTASATPTPRPTVPNLLGKTKVDAQKEAEKAGLRLRVLGEDFSDTYPKDQVMSQTIPEGSQVEAGAIIGVVISKGPSPLTMPNVIGWRQQDAKQLLEVMGLQVKIQTQSDEAPAGQVIGQQPEAGASVKEQDTVSIVVSSGPPQAPPTATLPPNTVVVPNLVGLPEPLAKQRIEQAGLSNTYTNWQRVTDVPPDARKAFLDTPVGSVVSQRPQPGTYVPKGTTVYIAARAE